MASAHGKSDDPRYWKWLGDEHGEYLANIRECVTRLHDDPTIRPLRFYTSHGLEHCQAVEDLIHRLIPRDCYTQLREKERFYLLAAAWLHDIGMLSTVVAKVWGEQLDDNEIRRCHHTTTAEFIRVCWHECGVKERDRFFLAELCRFHRKREDLREAPEMMLVHQSEYRFRLLAAYLRLADALHVDLSRVPDREFALCLAFNIPPETKLHWIKSRLVSGIHLDARQHVITLQFQQPNDDSIRDLGLDPSRVARKIDAVIRYVVDELRDELTSVVHTLTSGGISYYLDVQKTAATGVDPVTLKNLMTMVMNYDILVWPSASRLLNIVLENLAEISGYHLRAGLDPVKLDAGVPVGDIVENLRKFEQLLTEDLDSRRTYHLGIRSLLDQCRRFYSQDLFPLHEFVKYLNEQYGRQSRHRIDIRRKAADAATHLALPKSPDPCHVLLYGYSELVIKALSGLRDSRQAGPDLGTHALYGSPAELETSRGFRIFICDGQHKTHTAVQDRLLYHDGMSYAFALRERNFTNLVIIPDIVIGAALQRHHMDLLMVGANGFSDDAFHHSAGHGSVILMLRGFEREGIVKSVPKIVLVVSSDKYMAQAGSADDDNARPLAGDGSVRDVDGYAFWGGAGERTRDNVWINRDPRVHTDLRKAREHIHFYNPREEAIPIALVDYVICDVGIFPVRAHDTATTQKNIESFLSAVREVQPPTTDSAMESRG